MIHLAFRLLFIVVIYITINSSVQASVKIAVTNWPPYYSKIAPNGGLQLELINDVFHQINIPISYSWFRTGVGALVKVKANLINIAAGWECTQERTKDFFFSDPIGFEETVLFYHKEFNFDWSEISDLNRNITIGITARYAYGSDLKKLINMKNAHVEISGTDRHNLNLLYHREIDLFLLDKKVGLSLIKQAKEPLVKYIKFHPTNFRKNKIALRLLVSKKYSKAQTLIKKFNQALAEIRAKKMLFDLAPDLYPTCP